MIRRSYPLVLLALSLCLAVATLFALFGGLPGGLPSLSALDENETLRLILFEIRLPRLLMAVSVGAALALSGAAFQGFFRNSLADPYVIGVSSGAALGAALAMSAGQIFGAGGPFAGTAPFSPASSSAVALCAFAGALAAVFLAFAISRSAGNPPPAAALLLAGTALGAFFSGLLSLILVIKDQNLHRVYYWLLGSLSGASWPALFSLLPVMILGSVIIFSIAPSLDLLIQGDETAESLGLNVHRTRLLAALGASLAAAAAVSAAGIIGFVGLVAPHAVRMLAGPVHRRLLPGAALSGSLLVVLADILARSAAAPMEIPVGIITSLAGAPFFIYLLARHGRNLGRLS